MSKPKLIIIEIMDTSRKASGAEGGDGRWWYTHNWKYMDPYVHPSSREHPAHDAIMAAMSKSGAFDDVDSGWYRVYKGSDRQTYVWNSPRSYTWVAEDHGTQCPKVFRDIAAAAFGGREKERKRAEFRRKLDELEAEYAEVLK